MPKIFVSYSHDSDSHKTRVTDFVSRLRNQDVTVVYDQDIAKIGGPDEGWARWCERQLVEADFVLACCTAMFHERFDGEQQPDTSRGVAWEAQTIRQYLYDNSSANRKVRALLLEETDRAYIPNALRPYSVFVATHDVSYGELLGWLRVTPAGATPPPFSVDWLPPADDFVRQLADRVEEFERFKSMLSGRSAQRAFLIQGPSSSGKTALIHECIAYAEHRGVPHFHVDFKGGLSLEEAFPSLLFDLGQNTPRETHALAVIAVLQRLKEPLLLAFDSYHEAPQSGQNWIETRLLPQIDRCPALVVAIAGQTIPEKSARSWSPRAWTVSLRPIHRVEDWVDFAERRYGPTKLKPEHVEAFTFALHGDPGKVSAMLGVLAENLSAA
jgi:hypothetical protein